MTLSAASSPVAMLRRLVMILAISSALLLIPLFGPSPADARKMSDQQALSLCNAAGGETSWDITDSETMSGTFSCTFYGNPDIGFACMTVDPTHVAC